MMENQVLDQFISLGHFEVYILANVFRCDHSV